MAEQEIQQLKALFTDFFMRIESRLTSVENRLSGLEELVHEGAGKPKGPEPLLTCVQCLAEYKESENAEGHCKYHPTRIKYTGSYWNECTFTCCDVTVNDTENAKQVPGCTKGKHYSKHHSKYEYSNYYFYMTELSNKAKQLWLAMEAKDHITDSLDFAEVGLSKEGNVFVMVGTSRVRPEAFAEFTSEVLKHFNEPSAVVLEKSNPVGWTMKAEVHSSNSVANAITVSIKPASSKTPFVKRVSLVFVGDSPKLGDIETLSDPTPTKPSIAYTVPEVVKEGPELEPGLDYSKDRKNDYTTETDDDMFAIQLQQVDKTDVYATIWCQNGKWSQLFTTTIKATNGSPNIISITDVIGEYMNKDREWVKCDEVLVGLKSSDKFFDTRDFLIDSAAPMTLCLRLTIAFSESDHFPRDNQERWRAHRSLPQPLHLRVTFLDQEERSASLRFEQGNPPLPITLRKSREKKWNDGKPLEFYLFADDAETLKRSDAAILYDENGVLSFMYFPSGNSMESYYIRDLQSVAFKAKKAGQKEYELSKMRKESEGSKIEIFVVVDIDNEIPYALKVVITTTTSSAVGYYQLPNEDFSSATLTTDPDEVMANGNIEVSWSVPRASKNDKIEIYAPYAKKKEPECYYFNGQAETKGSTKMKAPSIPGLYEVRYYPSWMSASHTIQRWDTYIALTKFEVTTI